MNSIRVIFLCGGTLLLLIFFPGAIQGAETEGFKAVTGPCGFRFPADHGAHPGYRTEWWYYTGNLTAASGERFGFQLTFFRRQLQPSDARQRWPQPPSAWRTHQIYLAHAALTDISGRRHVMAEKASREGLGMAGAVQSPKGVRIFLHDWETAITPAGHFLRMRAPAFTLELSLVPTKGPVSHGDAGYSRKGSLPEQASCYYSFPRMTTSGRIVSGETPYKVTGSAWMDHEFSTAPLAERVTGWDWFSIQLDDQRELMMFLLRLKTGGLHPASAGTLIHPGGETIHLSHTDFQARVRRRWTSSTTGATYPLGWSLHLPGQGVTLDLAAALDDQEMVTTGSTGVTYWEGSVRVTGKAGGKSLSGQGYMELTGYADPEAPPL